VTRLRRHIPLPRAGIARNIDRMIVERANRLPERAPHPQREPVTSGLRCALAGTCVDDLSTTGCPRFP
ncbi:hypothetical protein QM277_19470, partial [Acinetobacter baumannii]|uniref:hypothetical protein n=1 Tax=Acinetobacter baumannii TaxID=470 RepID=UPI0024B74629